jgi:hypothetical protein
MGRQIAAALCLAGLCSALSGPIGSSSPAVAQQKSRDGGAPTQSAAKSARPAAPAAGSSNAPVYSSIRELMQSIIDPSADVLWGAAGAVIDKEGTHELAPKTEEDWLKSRRAAVRIIEGGNLLAMPGREAAPVGAKSEAPGAELEPAQITVLIRKNRKSFDAFAKSLQGVGVEALRAIDTKDAASLLDIGAQMEEVCESCHQTFWYPQARGDSTSAHDNRPHRNR